MRGTRVTGLGVVLAGLRHRAGRSLLIFTIAAFAAGAAVAGPAYSRAADQSLLADRIAEAKENQRSVALSADSDQIGPDVREGLQTLSTQAQAFGGRAEFAPPVVGVWADVNLPYQDTVGFIASRDGVCEHLRIVAGRCATGPGEVVAAAASRQHAPVAAGAKVELPTDGEPLTLTIVGLYEPLDATGAYWHDRPYFFEGGEATGEGSVYRLSTWFGTRETVASVPAFKGLEYVADMRLRTDRVDLDNVDAVVAHVESGRRAIRNGQHNLTVVNALPEIVDKAQKNQQAIAVSVPIAVAQLVLLCWFVLYLVVAHATDDLSPEIGVARLRGLPGGLKGVGESLLLTVLAVPVGFLAGMAVVEAVARSTLAADIHVEPRLPVFVICLVAVLGGLGAALAAARRTLGQPVTVLLRQVPVRRSRWGATAAEAMMVALAGAALFQLLITRGGEDQPSPLALATPALLAIVLGTVATKLLPVLARWTADRASSRGRTARMLASAQVARRPVATRVVVIGSVAVALLVFGAHAWDTADHNRKVAAGWQIGTDRVLTVEGPTATALVEAVRKADPSGRFAMAGLRARPSNGTGRSIVAVDTTRLAAVAAWDSSLTPEPARAVAAALRPATRPSVLLSGDTITVDVTVAEDTTTPDPLVLTVFVDDGRSQLPVRLGALTVGRHTYTAALPRCADGCRFVGIKAARPVGPEVSGDVKFVVTAVRDEDDRAVAIELGSLEAWRNADGRSYDSVSTVSVEDGGLAVAFRTGRHDESLVQRTDTPWPLPALATRSVVEEKRADAAIRAGIFEDAGAFTPTEIYRLTGEVPIIPRGGDNALLIDISYADIVGRSSFTGRYPDANLEVWLAAGAPADIRQRLRDAGVVIVREETYAERLGGYEREGPSLALILYLGTAGAAALLAVGAVGVSAYIGARRRRNEMGSLRMAGVSGRTLRRSIALEYTAVIGTLLVAGVGAGVLSVWLALPEVPIFTDPSTDGLSRLATEPVWASTLLAVTVAGLAAVVVLIVRGLTRGGDEEEMA